MHLFCPANDGSNRTALKTCLKYSTETQKKCRLTNELEEGNVAQQQ